MPDGKLRAYYWEVFTALAEIADLLNTAHRDHSFPSEDEVEHTAALYTTLVFNDGSRLIVHSSLDATGQIREHGYAYVYLDAHSNRVFQYDDAPHHPELPSHPHHIHKGPIPVHGPDKALSLDIPRVDFVAVLQVVRERLEKSKAAGG